MNETGKQSSRTKERIAVLIILAAIVIIFAFYLKDNALPLLRMQRAHDMEGARHFLRRKGLRGWISVILVQALQMVIVFVPAEFIQITSGLSYPLPLAILLCDLGGCLGATIIFLLVRSFKYNSSAYEKRRRTIDRLSSGLQDRNTILLIYLLFFMPIIPFGAICYYGSNTKLPFRKYLFTVATGVLPSILASNIMGRAGAFFISARLPFWMLLLIIVLLAALLFVLIFFFIKKFFFGEVDGTPDSMIYSFHFFLEKIRRGKKRHLEIDDSLLRGIDRPYIMLLRNESNEKLNFVYQIAHPRNPAFLISSRMCRGHLMSHMSKHGGMIENKLDTDEGKTEREIWEMIEKNYPVVFFADNLGLAGKKTGTDSAAAPDDADRKKALDRNLELIRTYKVPLVLVGSEEV
ncbi:MAG: VTT domain-containing protein, partial [Lachnospiraceae bacterium]|nr:VTT domain-containing protein [Lachnospiraceae bacterium]